MKQGEQEVVIIKVVRRTFLSCARADRYSARLSNGDSKACVSMRTSNGSMALAINLDCMICVTLSLFIDLSRGTTRARMSRNCCRSYPPTWGHLRISDTQAYLTMIPELLHEASVRFKRYAWKEGVHE